MGLFKPDFFRSLLLGFAFGAVLVAGSLGLDAVQVAPSAEAAAPSE